MQHSGKCQGNLIFFKVRELSMDFMICQNVREFYISFMKKVRYLVLMYLSCTIYDIFDSGNLEFISRQSQGIVREMSGKFVLFLSFWHIYNIFCWRMLYYVMTCKFYFFFFACPFEKKKKILRSQGCSQTKKIWLVPIVLQQRKIRYCLHTLISKTFVNVCTSQLRIDHMPLQVKTYLDFSFIKFI